MTDGTTPSPEAIGDNAATSWERLVEDLAAGRIPILDTFRAVSPIMSEKGDYEGFVTQTRAFHVLMKDQRIQKRLLGEITAQLEAHGIGAKETAAMARDIAAKDGPRLFDKLGDVHAEMYGGSPSLLAPGTFAECLAEYKRLMNHVENLWDDACRHYVEGRFPLCVFLSILTIEEVGKLGRLWFDLLAWDKPQGARKDLGKLGRDHQKKHFMGVIPGAVVNARLDRIVGKKPLKALLQDVESGKVERLRQACLYIDLEDGKVVLPEDRVSQDTAKFYVVLAGEMWAEILGHVPWEFERMIEKVIAVEKGIGFDESLVRQQ